MPNARQVLLWSRSRPESTYFGWSRSNTFRSTPAPKIAIFYKHISRNCLQFEDEILHVFTFRVLLSIFYWSFHYFYYYNSNTWGKILYRRKKIYLFKFKINCKIPRLWIQEIHTDPTRTRIGSLDNRASLGFRIKSFPVFNRMSLTRKADKFGSSGPTNSQCLLNIE